MTTIKVTIEAVRHGYPEMVRAIEADGYRVELNANGACLLHVHRGEERVATFTRWESVEIDPEKSEAKAMPYQTTDLTYEKPRVELPEKYRAAPAAA